jgi:hypothetical protein
MYRDIPPIREKVAETNIPRVMNTALKPSTKPTAALTSLVEFPSFKDFLFRKLFPFNLLSKEKVFVFLAKPIPPRILKYEGITGSTQGERKDKSPAVKTRNSEGTSVIIFIFILYYSYVNLDR